jgi:nucleoside-diphosphate-sugar epimerase
MEKQTILVTGGAGYIGSWVVKDLVEKGHNIRVSVRNKSNTEKYKHILDLGEKNPGTVELFEADLTKENSFDMAAVGCDSIIHMASPFILNHKDAQKNLVDPALNGTKYVLSSATKSGTVKKIVLTSSVAAVHGDTIDMQEQGLSEFTEDQWNTTSSLEHQPYSFSKVLAEKEAWQISKNQDQWKLVVINPSFVMGPSLAKISNSGSLDFMNDILSGKFKTGAPDLNFGFVDVRDVAKSHVLALESNSAEGRHILSERTMNVMSLAKIIESAFPKKYKLPTMQSPKWLMSIIGPMFGVTRKFVKRNVGFKINLNASKSINELKLSYTPIEKSIKDMVEWMRVS